MTYLDMIKRGVLTNDMKLVAAGYSGITGEAVEATQTRHRPLADEGIAETGMRKSKAIAGKQVRVSGENLFYDGGTGKIPVEPVVAKRKRASGLVNIKCEGCKQKFKVDKGLLNTLDGQNTYTCNDCILRKGK